jgi:hypothetical protein
MILNNLEKDCPIYMLYKVFELKFKIKLNSENYEKIN